MTSAESWARDEFGTAELGDIRRTSRLVVVAAEAATRPAGTVTGVCESSASREGAFRFLENAAVHVDAIRAATHAATAARCTGHERVFVAVDGTVLSVVDKTKRKGLGEIGSRDLSGLHVMSALAVGQDGVAIGICAQSSWARSEPSPHSGRKRSRADLPSETKYWTDALEDARVVLRRGAPDCIPWFQLDRGADCWQVFTWAEARKMLVTIRATHDRRVDGAAKHLWAAVERAPVIARRRIHVGARPSVQRAKRIGKRRVRKWMTPPRPARVACVTIRAKRVSLQLKTLTGERFSLPINAVLVRETRGPVDDSIEWMLLTTHPIGSRHDILEVVRGYSLRWRIEDFHRTWKRGLCRVEHTQLRSRSAIEKWATILGAVAARAMRLTKLARSTPDVPATSELSKTELVAIIALRKPKGISPDFVPTLGQAVRWLADIGGYVGPWNGPPGATVIGRGLHDVVVAARAFETLSKIR